MAKQTVTITRTTRRYLKSDTKGTVTHSSPAGKTKIGGSSKGKGTTKSRCPSCGKFR